MKLNVKLKREENAILAGLRCLEVALESVVDEYTCLEGK